MSIKRKVIVVIPASKTSGRFDEQPLVKILALPIVEHVRRRVMIAQMADAVYVATADAAIKDVVANYGGQVLTTAQSPRSSQGLVEAINGLKLDANDIVISIWGHEPLFIPEVLKDLADAMLNEPGLGCAALLGTIVEETEMQDRDTIKAVMDLKSRVMYFSRSPLPFRRVKNYSQSYRQLGFAAFTVSFLKEFAAWGTTPLEITEGIDFLRILENGHAIKGVVSRQRMMSIHRKEQVVLLEEVLRKDYDQSRIYQATLNL